MSFIMLTSKKRKNILYPSSKILKAAIVNTTQDRDNS